MLTTRFHGVFPPACCSLLLFLALFFPEAGPLRTQISLETVPSWR